MSRQGSIDDTALCQNFKKYILVVWVFVDPRLFVFQRQGNLWICKTMGKKKHSRRNENEIKYEVENKMSLVMS